MSALCGRVVTCFVCVYSKYVCVHQSLAPRASPDGIFWISGSVSASALILSPLYVLCVCVCVYVHCILGWNRQNFNYYAKLAHTLLFSACRLSPICCHSAMLSYSDCKPLVPLGQAHSLSCIRCSLHEK